MRLLYLRDLHGSLYEVDAEAGAMVMHLWSLASLCVIRQLRAVNVVECLLNHEESGRADISVALATRGNSLEQATDW